MLFVELLQYFSFQHPEIIRFSIWRIILVFKSIVDNLRRTYILTIAQDNYKSEVLPLHSEDLTCQNCGECAVCLTLNVEYTIWQRITILGLSAIHIYSNVSARSPHNGPKLKKNYLKEHRKYVTVLLLICYSVILVSNLLVYTCYKANRLHAKFYEIYSINI